MRGTNTMTQFDNVKAFIVDMDGVLWHGNNPADGMTEFFALLRKLNIPFVLATNNASLTQEEYIAKLAKMGVTITRQEIITSSMATARYLAKHTPKDNRRAFVIGEDGLRLPLIEQEFTLTDLYQIRQAESAEGPAAVIAGLDRKLTWDKLATATLNIRAGAEFFATNTDKTLPTELGEVMGNGGVIAALEAATGITATCIGKPAPILYQQALLLLGTNKAETVAIGDRLDTDILGAKNAGLRSILVLTGVSTAEDIDYTDYKPTWVMTDLKAITRALLG